MSELETQGWTVVASGLDAESKESLRQSAFTEGAAGTRCLLDVAVVRGAALHTKATLIQLGFLPAAAKTVQAIAFDKTPAANWKVTWHQDVVFPIAHAPGSPGYDIPSRKDGIDCARLPREILEQLLAVRIHLDDCDHTNGPLRVSSGSHRLGILKSADIPSTVAELGQVEVPAKEGEALLMKPLLLHASSPSLVPKHRRVLHFVYHTGQTVPEAWHRAL